MINVRPVARVIAVLLLMIGGLMLTGLPVSYYFQSGDAWPLLEAARRISNSGKHSAYVGANVGDIQAAKAANETRMFAAIGCVIGTPDKSALREAFEAHKANIILGHPNHLKESILG